MKYLLVRTSNCSYNKDESLLTFPLVSFFKVTLDYCDEERFWYTVELNSLKDIQEMTAHFKKSLIFHYNYYDIYSDEIIKETGLPVIEIYDDHRE